MKGGTSSVMTTGLGPERNQVSRRAQAEYKCHECAHCKGGGTHLAVEGARLLEREVMALSGVMTFCGHIFDVSPR